MDNISFYYVYWDFAKDRNIRYNWHTLLLSIICVKNVYPQSKVRIISYVNPTNEFKKLVDLCQVEIIYKNPAFVHKNGYINCCHNSNGDCQFLLSKPMDCYEVALEKNDNNVAICDIDYFLFRSFKNVDFSKVGVLYGDSSNPPPRVNTGLLLFGANQFNTQFFFRLYVQMLEAFNHQQKNIEETLKIPVYSSCQSLQEEICISLIVKKYFELNGLVFYNLTVGNHILYESMKNLDYSSNIHTAKLDKHRIVPVLLGSKKISSYIAGLKNNAINDIFKIYQKQSFSKEESFLQGLLDQQLPTCYEIKKDVSFTKSRKIFI